MTVRPAAGTPARPPADDQIFVAAFVRCHGSIKQMEKFFGVSYPTIKNRLNRIASSLEFVDTDKILVDRTGVPIATPAAP